MDQKAAKEEWGTGTERRLVQHAYADTEQRQQSDHTATEQTGVRQAPAVVVSSGFVSAGVVGLIGLVRRGVVRFGLVLALVLAGGKRDGADVDCVVDFGAAIEGDVVICGVQGVVIECRFGRDRQFVVGPQSRAVAVSGGAGVEPDRRGPVVVAVTDRGPN